MATVAAFPAGNEQHEGVTYAQAMEVFDRFFVRLEAAPTVAFRMGIPYKTAVRVLDGHVWPGARRYWLDRAIP